MIQDMLVG